MSLFNDDNSDSDAELKINTEYASIYDNFRQKEELHKREYKQFNPNLHVSKIEGKTINYITNKI